MRTATEAGWFADMPWGAVDRARNAELVMVDNGCKGGLLGGSSGGQKMSKLAALAKARKEKKAAADEEQKGTAVSLLDRLSTPKPPVPPTPPAQQDVPPIFEKVIPEPEPAPEPAPAPKTPEPAPPPPLEPRSPTPPPVEAPPQADPLKADASRFARSVFGARLEVAGDCVVADTRVFTLLGKNAKKPQNDPFAEPSPDDKVFAAQKGAKSKRALPVVDIC